MLANPDLPKAALAQHSADSVPLLDVVDFLEFLKVFEIENVSIFLFHGEYTILRGAAGILVPLTVVHEFGVTALKSIIILR